MSHLKWIIGGAVAVALILVARKMFASSPGESTTGANGGGVEPPSTQDVRDALAAIAASHGVPIARNVERIYRLETRNFDSAQFRQTNTPGMHAFTQAYPFGWKKRGTVPSDFAPLVRMEENAGGGIVSWVAFRQFRKAATYVADFLKDYGNNGGRWKSTEADAQARYRGALENVPSPIVDNL